VRIDTLDLGGVPNQEFDWCHTVYGDVKEVLPTDLQKPLGKSVKTITYKYANFYHDMTTGGSFTIILHICNITLID
jgi:hypothetical protein